MKFWSSRIWVLPLQWATIAILEGRLNCCQYTRATKTAATTTTTLIEHSRQLDAWCLSINGCWRVLSNFQASERPSIGCFRLATTRRKRIDGHITVLQQQCCVATLSNRVRETSQQPCLQCEGRKSDKTKLLVAHAKSFYGKW